MPEQPTVSATGLTEEQEARARLLVRRIADMREKIAQLVEYADNDKAELRELLKPSGDDYDLGADDKGPLRVHVQQKTFFNAERAKMLLPADVIIACTEMVPVLNEEKVKAIIPPKAYEACRVGKGKAAVTVK